MGRKLDLLLQTSSKLWLNSLETMNVAAPTILPGAPGTNTRADFTCTAF